MTDTKLLKEAIEKSGYKIHFIASRCNLSYQGLLNKINNVTEFKATEIITLKKMLGLSEEEASFIFFNEK